jgi:hypothetical protein
LIEEIMEETVNELSVDDPLGECLTALGGDMNLDTLLEQANAMLDSAMARETDTEGTIETSSPNPSSLATEPIKRELKPL